MVYQALARKWRPRKFADLVGQEHVVKALQNALAQGRLHHAYLLTGTRGVGKTTIARILAKSLNCESGIGGEPCGVCSACTQIDAGRFVDLLEIDAASNTGIDNIREVLENAQYAPTVGRYKVYIIDEVHMLSKSAFNAMLKTLEEPPEHVKFILATTDPHKVPVTVLSRCLQFVLRNMTPQQISKHLAYILEQENVPAEEAALVILGRFAMGSMRDALSLLDQAIALGSGKVAEADVRHMLGAVDKRYLFMLLQELINQNGQSLIDQAEQMNTRAVSFDSALGELAALLQQIAIIQAVPTSLAADDPEKETLSLFAQALSAEQIQLYYQCALQGKQDLPLAPDEYAGFVMTLLRMLAFAPLAAKSDQLNWQVTGTNLSSELNTQTLSPPTVQKVAIVQEPETVKQDNHDTVAKVVHYTEPQNHDVESEEQVTDLPWEDQVSTARETPKEQTDTAPDPSSEVMPESVDTIENKATLLEKNDDSVQQESTIKDESENLIAQTLSETSLKEVAQPSGFVTAIEQETETFDANEYHEQEIQEVEQSNIVLPELTPNTWSEVVALLSSKLGAAQMLAKNAALIDISDNILQLAISDYAVSSKEMLDKMAKVLSEAYSMNWHIQTEQLQTDHLTPNMLHTKDLEAKKAQAFSALEADPVAQEFMDLFEAKWVPESVKLNS
ncbi:DNA polymerase III subunit gamma/tau [Neisseria sp. Ec49-e6-T10]|uniref:DNA polymerase III subunit gamma/tau n=1 Tax=Neisseria sp. Ec49-e6-T10 TaxID=3140744 RepID=UPI003EBCAD22